MIIYSDTSWPLWARIAIAVFSVGLLGVLIWWYYQHFWRR
jgi:plastocyanin domain-containing protein